MSATNPRPDLVAPAIPTYTHMNVKNRRNEMIEPKIGEAMDAEQGSVTAWVIAFWLLVYLGIGSGENEAM